MDKKELRIALIGNPNTGKSTLFNALTGLNQKTGNFAGVTIDKKTGVCSLPDGKKAKIIDLPGIYSLYPKSPDETIAVEVLCDSNNENHPDLALIIVDASNLKRNLLLFSQVADLDIPVILVLNMIDVAERSQIAIDIEGLESMLGVPVIPMNAHDGRGNDALKLAMIKRPKTVNVQFKTDTFLLAPQVISEIKVELGISNNYIALQTAHQFQALHYLSIDQKNKIEGIVKQYEFSAQKIQATETINRYSLINDLLFETVRKQTEEGRAESYSNRIDKVLTHKVGGLLIFMLILFIMFQSIFSFAQYPMDLIAGGFTQLAGFFRTILPTGVLSSLFIDGILAGLSGVVVFVPQIVILFAFIAVLEDTGYMARVTFMMDRLMRKVGLNGKSVVPLISGIACAVPAIMSARTIENWKERMITIMVTPLMSCSARLPVYILLISLMVPNESYFGIINLQGLALMGMYLITFLMALAAAFIMKKIMRARGTGYFIMELPVYRMPRWNTIVLTLIQKSKTFVWEAGKVIVLVSVILWALASYGPPGTFEAIDKKYAQLNTENAEITSRKIRSEQLEASYAGLMGRVIEPVIEPLGFDWKIGIALITSFAAREVFVGTMATIYSVEGDENNIQGVLESMKQAKNPKTGLPVYTTAVAFSLMLFYAFALQCMSTIAVVYRETKSIKWPMIQLAYMTALAYISSFIAFQLLS